MPEILDNPQEHGASDGIPTEEIAKRISSIEEPRGKVEATRFSLQYLLAKGRPLDSLYLLQIIHAKNLPFNEGERDKVLNGILKTAERLRKEDPIQAWDTIWNITYSKVNWAPYDVSNDFTREEYEKLNTQEFKNQQAETLARYIECYLDPNIEIKGRERFAREDLRSYMNNTTGILYELDFDKVFNFLDKATREKLLAVARDHSLSVLIGRLQRFQKAVEDKTELAWEQLSLEGKIQQAVSSPFDAQKNPFDGAKSKEIDEKLLNVLEDLVPSEAEKLRELLNKGNPQLNWVDWYSTINAIKDINAKMQVIKMVIYSSLIQGRYSMFDVLTRVGVAKLGSQFGEDRKNMVKAIFAKALIDEYGLDPWNIVCTLIQNKSNNNILTEKEYEDIDAWLGESTISTFSTTASSRIEFINSVYFSQTDKEVFLKDLRDAINFADNNNILGKIWEGLDGELKEKIRGIQGLQLPEGYQDHSHSPAQVTIPKDKASDSVDKSIVITNISKSMEDVKQADIPAELNKFLKDTNESQATFIFSPVQVKEYMASMAEGFDIKAGNIKVDKDNQITISDLRITKSGVGVTLNLALGNDKDGIAAKITKFHRDVRASLNKASSRVEVERQIKNINSAIKKRLDEETSKDNPLWKTKKVSILDGKVLIEFEKTPQG